MPNCGTYLFSFPAPIAVHAVSRNGFANISFSVSSLCINRTSPTPAKMSMLHGRPSRSWLEAREVILAIPRAASPALPPSLVSFGPTDRRKRTKTFLPLLIRHIWFSPPRSLEISSGREKDRGRGKQWIDSCRLQRQLAWKWMEEGGGRQAGEPDARGITAGAG